MTSDGVRYTFIVGHRKSGSTWLLNLLSLHPDIRGLAETHLFRVAWTETDLHRRNRWLFRQTPWGNGGTRHLLANSVTALALSVLRGRKPAARLRVEERPATLLDLPRADRRELERVLLRTSGPEEYAQRFLQFHDDRLRPPRYLLEKSPSNVLYLQTLRHAFPAARLIAIYRDGRDVVTSDMFFTRYTGGSRFDFAAAVHDWNRRMIAHLAGAAGSSFFACAYERLLMEEPAVVGELLAFLDLPADRAVVADMMARSSFRFYAGRDRGEEDRKRFYRKGIAGDWKNHFSAEQKEIFKEIAGDMLIRLGYTKDMDW